MPAPPVRVEDEPFLLDSTRLSAAPQAIEFPNTDFWHGPEQRDNIVCEWFADIILLYGKSPEEYLQATYGIHITPEMAVADWKIQVRSPNSIRLVRFRYERRQGGPSEEIEDRTSEVFIERVKGEWVIRGAQ